jgi:hypothetical protein
MPAQIALYRQRQSDIADFSYWSAFEFSHSMALIKIAP